MCRQHFGYNPQPAGAWIDSSPAEEKRETSLDTDLSYWSELGLCYQPEWYPLAGKVPSCK